MTMLTKCDIFEKFEDNGKRKEENKSKITLFEKSNFCPKVQKFNFDKTL